MPAGRARSAPHDAAKPPTARATQRPSPTPAGLEDCQRRLRVQRLRRTPSQTAALRAVQPGGRGADPPNPALKVPAVRVLAVVWVCHGPRTGRLLLAFRGLGHVRPLGPLG